MTAAASTAQLPRTGDIVAGKYVLDQLIGQGGMGAVFSARHIKLSKAVAIKIMLADASNPEAAQRFINEGRAAANIQNEHVVRVDDVDEELGYAYMVLELLDGEDLAQLLEREPTRRLAPHVAVNYVVQALRGVMQAHHIGIVHRDLKPSNLFLARRKDGTLVVKVLDFGISKAQGSSALAASPSALTSTKAMLGSPLYMSPEQLRSSKSVDHRADIWAMGVILYELMTGHLPFMGDNLGELFAAILETDPVPVRQRADGVHPALDEIVLRCLQRRPDQRFQSAADLAQALAPFVGAALGSNLPVSQSTAFMAPPSHPGAITPSQAQSFPHPVPGAITSDSGPRPVTVAIGAPTPQGMQHQTGGGWQSPGAMPPRSKTPLIALVAGGLVLVSALAFAAAYSHFRAKPAAGDPTAGSATVSSSAGLASAPPPPTVDPHPSADPPPTVDPHPSADPPPPSAMVATATPASAASPTSKVSPTHRPPTSGKEPPTSRVDPPPPVVVAPPKPKASSGSPDPQQTR